MTVTLFRTALGLATAIMTAAGAEAATIAQWTFDSPVQPVFTSIRDTVSDPFAANLGAGELVITRAIGGFRNPFVTAGATVSFNATTGEGFLSTTADRFGGPRSLDFTVSTLDAEGISFSADTVRTDFRSGVSFTYSYSVDGGSVFHQFGGASPVLNAPWRTGAFNVSEIALTNSLPTPDDLSSVIFRVIWFGGSLTGDSGSAGFDNATISAATIAPALVPAPPALALMLASVGLFGLLRRLKAGRAGGSPSA